MDEQDNQAGAAGEGTGAPSAPPVDVTTIQNAFKRAADIAIKPKSTWEAIKLENPSPVDVYLKYLALLSAILPLVLFIKLAIIGFPTGTVVGRIRMPFIKSLFHCVMAYAYLLAFPYLVGLITQVIAPNLELSVKADTIFKMMAFSILPALLSGVLFIVTMDAGMLFDLVLLYGVYIFYLGIPVMTDVPESKRLHLLGVVVGSAAILQLIMHYATGVM